MKEEYLKIAKQVVDVVVKKNTDYNSAFEHSYNEYGWVAYLIRIQDKLNRLKSLTVDNKEAQIKSESINDTLLDIAGYTLLMQEILQRTKNNDFFEENYLIHIYDKTKGGNDND